MRRPPKATKPSQIAPLCIALSSLASALHAHAEAPMQGSSQKTENKAR